MNDFDIPLNNELPLTTNPQELVPSSLLEAKELVTDDSSSTSNSSMLPTSEEDILRYEMEELKLSNYLIESNDASSGGKHISLLGSDRNSGTAAGVFNGEAGTYQVNVGFYDESPRGQMRFIRYILDYSYALLEYFDDLFRSLYGSVIFICIIWGLAGFCFVQAISH